MNNKETALELLLKADGLIGKAKELLAQAVDDESERDTTYDILAAWVQAISTAPYFYLGVCGDLYSTFEAIGTDWQKRPQSLRYLPYRRICSYGTEDEDIQ